MPKATPIHEIFLSRARGVGHLMRFYFPGLDGFRSDESLSVDMIPGSGTTGPTLRYWRRWISATGKRRHGFVEFANITAADPRSVVFGPETTLKSEVIASLKEPVHNGGYAPITVKFEDVFGKETADEESEDKSAGTSVKVAIESEQDIEGFAKFKESVEAEAHAEVSESSSHSEAVSTEQAGGEETEIPEGKTVIITETRSRADTVQTVTASGRFTHTVRVGQYTPHVKPQHKWWAAEWPSWDQFKDVVHGDAPDNWPMVETFKAHPPQHGDMWALADVNAPLRYEISFEGKIIRAYSVDKAASSQ